MSESALKKYSWKSISSYLPLTETALIGNAEQDKAVEDFGKLWQLFADDYADSFSVDAYNSFKHGFRVRLGGMKISFQPVKSSENPDPPKDYQELGNSEFGVTFYVAQNRGSP